MDYAEALHEEVVGLLVKAAMSPAASAQPTRRRGDTRSRAEVERAARARARRLWRESRGISEEDHLRALAAVGVKKLGASSSEVVTR